MADRLEFKEKLSGILSAAREQGGKIALEDVELYFGLMSRKSTN